MLLFQQVSYIFGVIYKDPFSIYLPYFTNDLSKQFLVVAKMFSLPDG